MWNQLDVEYEERERKERHPQKSCVCSEIKIADWKKGRELTIYLKNLVNLEELPNSKNNGQLFWEMECLSLLYFQLWK